jgi:CubicO group peptidase (beta-lactamase class C family)
VTFLADLQSRLDEAAARHRIPGAAVAAGRGNDFAEAATGVVNRNTGVAATPQSLFQIGSVTKIWTAALVLQLVDDGLVDLDQPVRRYLPAFAVADPSATSAVTIRHLLTHGGGFDGDLFEDTGRGDDAVERYLAYLRSNARQLFRPGSLVSYCNSGYVVLGALVAHLRGGTWESVLRERLIEPLGARHMAALAEEAVLFRVAAGHLGPDHAVTPRWQLPRSNAPAGATLCAAPRDLVRFGRMFFGGGPLSPDAIAAMTSPQVPLPGVPIRGAGKRGLGPVLFDWDGTAAFGHDGDTIGQSATWRVVPSHEVVVAMTANSSESAAFFADVLDPVVHELTGLTVPPRPVPPAAGVTAPGPTEYAGRYRYPLCAYDVTATGDGLEVTATPLGVAAEFGDSPSTERYVALAGDTFIAAEPTNGLHATITFLDGGRYLYGGRAAPRVDEAGKVS